MSEPDVINRRQNNSVQSSDSNELENDEESQILEQKSQASTELSPDEFQTIETAYEKAGGTGRFHALLLFSSIIACNSMGVF